MTEFEKPSFSVPMYNPTPGPPETKRAIQALEPCPECGAHQLPEPDKMGTYHCKHCDHLWPRMR